MSPELHSSYRLTIVTVTPVHIGSGNRQLLLDYDYVIRGSMALVFNLDRILRETDVDRLRIASTDPKLSLLLGTDELDRHKAYEIDIPAGSKPERVREHVRDAFMRLYIPGSTLKGVLRTALAWYAHYGALTLSTSGERRDWRKADDPLESALLDYDVHQPHRDLLHALRITDAYPHDNIRSTATAVSVYSLRGQPPSLQRREEPKYVEVIPSGAILEATLSLNRYILRPERRVRGMYHFRRRHFFDQLVDRCREFSGEHIKAELDFYSDCGIWKLQGFYETLTRRQASLKADEFLIPVGWGTGWRSKTLGTKLTSHEVNTIAETYRLDRWRSPIFPRIFPKTRHLVGDRMAREPLGWVKMQIQPIGLS